MIRDYNKTAQYMSASLMIVRFLQYSTMQIYLPFIHMCMYMRLWNIRDKVRGKNFTMQICPCNEDSLTPHFNIVKLGSTGVYLFYFCSKT